MQPVPCRQTSSYFIGCGLTRTSFTLGAAPVIAPPAPVGKTTCDMNTFHFWPDFELGSATLSLPYQTAAARPAPPRSRRARARPAPPACSHGKMFTASPVAVEPSLTWKGGVHVRQPLAALDALTKTWRWPGLLLSGSSSAQTTNRLRAWSSEAAVNSTLGSPGR